MSEQLYPGARLREHLRGSWRLWRHRWKILGAVGLTEEKWHALPLLTRRAVIAGVIGVVLLVILAPLSGFDAAAFITYAIFVLFLLFKPEGLLGGRRL